MFNFLIKLILDYIYNKNITNSNNYFYLLVKFFKEFIVYL